MNENISFKITIIDKENESFEVEWNDGNGNTKTLNYNLPENMYLDNVTEDKLKEFISRKIPREILYSDRELQFPINELSKLENKDVFVSEFQRSLTNTNQNTEEENYDEDL